MAIRDRQREFLSVDRISPRIVHRFKHAQIRTTLTGREDTMIREYAFSICLLLMCALCDGHAQEKTNETSLKLYVFDCGMLRFASIESFSIADNEIEIRDLSVPCYMVEHEKGRLLWDGGLPSDTVDQDGWHGKSMQMRLDRTLADQLVEVGLNMSSFDFVAFSHMHFDHVGVANEISMATLIIQRTEYEAAFADEVTMPGFKPSLYSQLAGVKKIIIEGDHDVFGDGKVRIISAPGHTPGHQVLFVDLHNTGPLVLSGDLYHFAISRRDRRVPRFNHDRENTLTSMDRVESFVQKSGAKMWIQHELAHFKDLKKSPLFYD
jgi:glyoxylase-like metal-dependent hydrolase (beta-lactamase superfamily II)